MNKKPNCFLATLANLLNDNQIIEKYSMLVTKNGLSKKDSRTIVKEVFQEYEMEVELRTLLWLNKPHHGYIPIFDIDTTNQNEDYYLVFIVAIAVNQYFNQTLLVLKHNNNDQLILHDANKGTSVYMSKYEFFYKYAVSTIETFCLLENEVFGISMFNPELIATLLPHQDKDQKPHQESLIES